MKQKNFLNKIEYDKLYPSGSAPARFYDTPNVHTLSSSDQFPKVRPIVLAIGAFNYSLARFYFDYLSPNDYSCNDTFSCVCQIKNANLSKKFLVSYKVTTIFTNIPLEETIAIATSLFFNYNRNLNIAKKALKTFPFRYITDSFYF